MNELIETLGDSFRGLWRSYYCDWNNGELTYNTWTVTFIYKGHYVETPDMNSPEEALKFAVKKLKEESDENG